MDGLSNKLSGMKIRKTISLVFRLVIKRSTSMQASKFVKDWLSQVLLLWRDWLLKNLAVVIHIPTLQQLWANKLENRFYK